MAVLDRCLDLSDAHTHILSHSFLCSLPTKAKLHVDTGRGQPGEAPEERRRKGAGKHSLCPALGLLKRQSDSEETLPAGLLLGTNVPTHLGVFVTGKNDIPCPGVVVKWLISPFPRLFLSEYILNFILFFFFSVNAIIPGRL